MSNDIKFPLGQLRHLYKNMVNGWVDGQKGIQEIATYLLGPAIERLEEYQNGLDRIKYSKPIQDCDKTSTCVYVKGHAGDCFVSLEYKSNPIEF
jgi:hypothetical protein